MPRILAKRPGKAMEKAAVEIAGRRTHFIFSTRGCQGRFDVECGGKREYGRDAAFMRRDFRRVGNSKRLCKVKSGVAVRTIELHRSRCCFALPPHSIKEAPKKMAD